MCLSSNLCVHTQPSCLSLPFSGTMIATGISHFPQLLLSRFLMDIYQCGWKSCPQKSLNVVNVVGRSFSSFEPIIVNHLTPYHCMQCIFKDKFLPSQSPQVLLEPHYTTCYHNAPCSFYTYTSQINNALKCTLTIFIPCNFYPCDEHVYTYMGIVIIIYSMCNDDYLIVTTDTSVMTSSTPGATPNTPPGIYEVQIISWQITVTKCCSMLITQFCAASAWGDQILDLNFEQDQHKYQSKILQGDGLAQC